MSHSYATALAMCALVLAATSAGADITISNKPTQNMSCDSGVCTATASKAVLNVVDLQTMLASGDATVKTGTVANNVDLDQPLTWSSRSRLTLDARQSVVISLAMTITGSGSLTLTTNDGGKKGELLFFGKGQVSFWDSASGLKIDGRTYELVTSLSMLGSKVAVDPSGAYALARSYDAKGEVYDLMPVKTTFTGFFEGLGNAVSNVKIRRQYENCSGVFAQTGSATVRDISLRKVEVTSKGSVGGLVGCNYGTIVNASVEGRITASTKRLYTDVGGVVGDNQAGGLISRSRSSIKMTGIRAAGGIAGGNYQGKIDSCFATGSVQVLSDDYGYYFGGLVGDNEGSIINSYSEAQVTGGEAQEVGGLVGGNYSAVNSSYSTGTVVGGETAGGLAGYDLGNTTNSFWDLDTSGITDPGQGAGYPLNDPNIIGLTDAQLKAGLPAGFDPKIWGHSPTINNGYPYLLANPPE